VNSLAERLGWSSLSILPSDEAFIGNFCPDTIQAKVGLSNALLDHFRSRTRPKFFAGFDEKERTIQELRAGWPGEALLTIERANQVLEGRFDLLGFADLSFGDEIDWHFEPITQRRIPAIHWSRLDYLDAAVAGDKKIVWELNRHQYFAILSQAYWLTADERYARGFVAHIESWMDQNPPKLGINWASSLEIAFRSISWLWALYFFKDSPALLPSTFIRILKFLYLNARHIETYLSTYFSPNTHLTGEALGLFYLGTLFPEFKDANRWKKKGNDILLGELSRHVRPDGVYFEQSSYYHRYTVDFYTHYLILMQETGNPVPEIVRKALSSMLDHLMYITRPDGKTPLFGDDDGGRLVKLDQRAANDFRNTLAVGAVLFERPDYKFVAGDASESVLWVLGPKGLETFKSIKAREPQELSKAFPDGGYYALRDSWAATANYLLFDCGPHGSLSNGHSHADALGFELFANGRTQLVDPATYTYTGSKEMRDWFRSSSAHNTLTVDSESSSMPGGPFSWKTTAKCETLNWISTSRFDYVEGQHTGYLRLPQPVSHRRSILFIKNDYWIMRDDLGSKGDHKIELWFHADPSLNLSFRSVDGEIAAATLGEGTSRFEVAVFGDGCWRKEPGWVSHCYGEKQPAQVGVYAAAAKGDKQLLTFMLPQGETVSRGCSLCEMEVNGGNVFQITHNRRWDVVMIGDRSNENLIESGRLTSDGEWTWVRFSGSEEHSALEELILLGGRTLRLDGKTLLDRATKVDYLIARRINGGLVVETPEGTRSFN
jgi:hypothetical protein